MNLPFTVEQFLEVFFAYNVSIWPVQIAAYALGVLAVSLLFVDSRTGDRVVSLILSLMWIWTGLLYHVTFFSRINRAAYLFGLLFVAAGIMFLWYGTFRGRLSYRWRTGFIPAVGAFFILYAMVLYPLVGYLSGHIYPSSPVFGVTPCPVTIFTFGLLLMADQKVPASLLVIPFLWSLVGGSAAWLLGVPEDYGLIAAGVVGTVLVVARNRQPGS